MNQTLPDSIPFHARILTKLFLSFLVIGVLTTSVFFFSIRRLYNQELEEMTAAESNYTQTTFKNLEERDTKILSSVLEVLIQDPKIKEVYLEKDRSKLYDYVSPLFQRLKIRYGITHWYFISPDGKTFLRAHGKDIFDDQINRFTFQKARDSQKAAAGVELGKTAYALRVVMPYYDQGKLIGYMELGEEIDHFLKILKGETDNDFSIIADKEFLNHNDWTSVRKVAGLADNWDDLADHLIIAGTPVENKVGRECFTEKNLEDVETNKTIPQSVETENKTFRCAGFAVVDPGGKHSGAVLSAINVTPHILALKKATQEAAILSAVLFMIVSLLSILMSRLFLEPIKKLTHAVLLISGGDLSVRANPGSRDEIGQLAQSFNKMTDSLLKNSADIKQKAQELETRNEELETASAELEEIKTGLEQEVQQRTADLQNKLLELEKFNAIAVGRELEMVKLKKEIARLGETSEKEQNNVE